MSALLRNEERKEKEIEVRIKEADALRKLGGTYLKGLREQRSLKQRELAHLLDILYYTKISAIENGRERISEDLVEPYGKALKVPNMHEFTMQMIKFFWPHLYKPLNSDD
jgi:DNA-binding XRE family transcriptional regulator